ncbi:MAG: hypothetical protein HW416_2641, partial [Chloroflexi bacterium]|nr:hypothetical protein [Chloroflexota bacterium]
MWHPKRGKDRPMPSGVAGLHQHSGARRGEPVLALCV